MAFMCGFRGLDDARPGDMFFNRPALNGREFLSDRFVSQQIEDRAFSAYLGAEAVHHANSVFLICTHHGMRKIEADQEFLKADTAVENIDGEIAAAQDAVAIFELFRRYDLGRISFAGEEFGKLREVARTPCEGLLQLRNGD